MDFLEIVGGFLAAFVIVNTYTRIKWWLGYRPKTYNEKQANITAKRCASAYAEYVSVAVAGMTPEQKQYCTADTYEFCRYVILHYLRQLELPEFDTGRNPIGGRSWEDEETRKLIARIV